MALIRRCLVYALLVGVLTRCGDGRSGVEPETVDEDRLLSGGAATVFDASSLAFENPIPSLNGEEMDRFLAGDAAFEQVFVTAPAEVGHGLGPVFNQTSCVGCHARDGRGREGFGDTSPFLGSMLMRVSLPGFNPEVPGAPRPVPGFGEQIGDRAVFGVKPEARVEVVYFEETRHFADGQAYAVRIPQYHIYDAYQPLPAGVLTSPRMAPPVFGRGLLEAVPEGDILALADPGDGDGISGRPNMAYNFRTGRTELGRFGLKANNPDLLQQVASAYHQDMGITSPYFPRESTATARCRWTTTGTIPRSGRKPWRLPPFTSRPWRCPPAATSTTPRFGAVKSSSPQQDARAATSPPCAPGATRLPPCPGRPSTPTPTCCSTIWAKNWPTADRTSRPTGANGALLRCGESA